MADKLTVGQLRHMLQNVPDDMLIDIDRDESGRLILSVSMSFPLAKGESVVPSVNIFKRVRSVCSPNNRHSEACRCDGRGVIPNPDGFIVGCPCEDCSVL